MDGWIKLHRKICEKPLWTCENFTRGQAWIDLILLANHKYSYFYKRNVKIEVDRGQVARSEVELSDRWSWSRSKVRKFLKDLEKEQQIKQQKSNVTLIVTIINYDEYQQKEQQDEQQKDSKKTPKEQQKNTYKNEKNEKNEKNIIDREKLFQSEILKHKEKYSKEMLSSFFIYWSEKTKSGNQMRFEQQKTWETGKRLATWKKNNERFNSK